MRRQHHLALTRGVLFAPDVESYADFEIRCTHYRPEDVRGHLTIMTEHPIELAAPDAAVHMIPYVIGDNPEPGPDAGIAHDVALPAGNTMWINSQNLHTFPAHGSGGIRVYRYGRSPKDTLRGALIVVRLSVAWGEWDDDQSEAEDSWETT